MKIGVRSRERRTKASVSLAHAARQEAIYSLIFYSFLAMTPHNGKLSEWSIVRVYVRDTFFLLSIAKQMNQRQP